MESSSEQVTLLLHAMKQGDAAAAERLLPLVYAELHRLARGYMRRERIEHTLQPTALINEAFLRLAPQDVDWQNRQHFLGIAANVMRRVLVDHARTRQAEKHGGAYQRVDLHEGELGGADHVADRTIEVLALDQALNRLQANEPRQARVVELRYFGGLTLEEIAALTGIALRTVKRDWALARIWLFEAMAPRAGSN